jgi:hypothetical protein
MQAMHCRGLFLLDDGRCTVCGIFRSQSMFQAIQHRWNMIDKLIARIG